ncbi:hypothetical protein [Roseomonas sp. KE2513]|uniref:hypothetical protein n=1 Tax=Roseomonas sp. KE2513 TaxID=2479202 RepID=UPI0018DF441D|nr:hypothetical protein [Roseomonas sp. KE2513]
MSDSTIQRLRPVTYILARAARGWVSKRPPIPSSTAKIGAPSRTVTRTVTVLTGFAALLIAAALPVTYLSAAHFRLRGALEASATLHAAEVAELSRVNPALWEFEGLRISAPAEGRASVERRRVFNEQGRLVIESVPGKELAWPVLSHREPINEGGQKLGEAEAARSMRDALLTMLLVACASVCLGGAICTHPPRAAGQIAGLRLTAGLRDHALARAATALA